MNEKPRYWTIGVQGLNGRILLKIDGVRTPGGPVCGAHLAHVALGNLLNQFHAAFPKVEVEHAWTNEQPPPCGIDDDDDGPDDPVDPMPDPPSAPLAKLELPPTSTSSTSVAQPGRGWFSDPAPIEARETAAVFVCEDGHETRVAVNPQEALDRSTIGTCTTCRRPCTYRGSEYTDLAGVVTRHLRQRARRST